MCNYSWGPNDIVLTFYDPTRCIIIGANTNGTAVRGSWNRPLIAKVAMLAFQSGAVLKPPPVRANISMHVTFVDSCDTDTGSSSNFVAMSSMNKVLSGVRGCVPGARGAVGGSEDTAVVARFASVLGVPNIGFNADSADFSDKGQYPFFVRMSQNLRNLALTYIRVFRTLGYTKAMLWHSVDAGGMDAKDTFVKLSGLKDTKFTLDTNGVPHGDLTGLPPLENTERYGAWMGLLNHALNKNAHLHLVCVDKTSPMMDLFHWLALHNLMGKGYQWMGFDVWLSVYVQKYLYAIQYILPTFLNQTSVYADVTAVDGYIVIQPQGEGPLLDKFLTFWNSVRTRKDDFFEPFLARQSDWFDDHTSEWMSIPIGAFLFDAMWGMMLAVNAMALEAGGANFTGAALLEKIRHLEFEGISGNITFNENGDRNLSFNIRQIWSCPWKAKVAYANGTSAWPTNYTDNLVGVASPTYCDIQPPLYYYGCSTTPPPDQDLLCSKGSYYDRTNAVCVNCTAGKYTPEVGASACLSCSPGSFGASAAMSQCQACPQGYHSTTEQATACVGCDPGTYMDEIQQILCRSCRPGAFAETNSTVTCGTCPRGSFANGTGSTACTPCPPGRSTQDPGATSSDVCLCMEGTYSLQDGSACLPCPVGMYCAFGSTVGSARGTAPVAKELYMALRSEPLQAYLCLTSTACPGGPPGTCGRYRDPEKVACGQCENSAYESGGNCHMCDNNDLGPFIATLLGGLVAVCLMTVIVNRNLLTKTNDATTVTVMCGLALTCVQTLGLFRTLSIGTFEPMTTVLRLASVLSFDIRVIKAACVVGSSPVEMFLLRQSVAPAVLVSVACSLVVKKKVDPKSVLKVELCNSIGHIFTIFFLPIMLSLLNPFICYPHPGDLGSSMVSAPSILCFHNRSHGTMVIGSLIALLIVPVPYLTIVSYGIQRYPEWISQHDGGGFMLRAMHFLFYRYKPERYFYGAIMLTRSMCMCLVPIVIRDDPALQVFLTCAVLVFFTLLQQHLAPWRSTVANIMDGAVSGSLLLLLVLGSMAADFTLSMKSITQAWLISSILAAIGIGIGLAVTIRKYLVPRPYYHMFLSHHKAHAAAQARLLKLMLESRRTLGVFIDSDDLTELDTLFDTIKTKVGHMVAYLTRDTLRRPWCAGELVTTHRMKLNVTVVRTPSFQNLTPQQLHDMAHGSGTYVEMEGANLNQYSITLPDIAAAYEWLLGPHIPVIELQVSVKGIGRFDDVAAKLLKEEVIATKEEGKMRPGMLLVSVDFTSDEALACAGVLLRKIQRRVFELFPNGIYALFCDEGGGHVLARFVRQCHAALVMLTPGTLTSNAQLMVIFELMRLAEKSQHGGDDQHMTSGGMHDLSSATGHPGAHKLAAPAPPAVLVQCPGFVFPCKSFYSTELPRALKDWPDGAPVFAEIYIAKFFKRISVSFATHASDTVLNTQASEVVSRIPPPGRQGHHSMDSDVNAPMAGKYGKDEGADGGVTRSPAAHHGHHAHPHLLKNVKKDQKAVLKAWPGVSRKDDADFEIIL